MSQILKTPILPPEIEDWNTRSIALQTRVNPRTVRFWILDTYPELRDTGHYELSREKAQRVVNRMFLCGRPKTRVVAPVEN